MGRERRISVGSAHSASTIDAEPFGSSVGSGGVKRSGSGGKKLQKKWVIE